MSADSNHLNGASCGTMAKSGTSMASPAAAGVAALIRQYFIDRSKKFWSTICKSRYSFCKPFIPSGVLVKAVLLHSGKPMKAFWSGDNILPLKTSPPDNYQGYGLITLSTVLPLNASAYDLFVDDLRSISQNAIVSYTVTVANARIPLKVTISWYDYPAADGTTTPALINDLDLEVVSLNANIRYSIYAVYLYFSFCKGFDELHRLHGNLGAKVSFDKLNNNEQVFVRAPAVGDWQVGFTSINFYLSSN
jgi:Subtilase family